ncbi:alanine--glyoxylate aminotransferase family protein [Omnitrophica bacterium]|nr:alanine--glyoxylate aminotransferase family protein [Candidatus Omnitrophota bacterium]
MKRQLLMTPGPTPVPEEIAKKMAEPIIHHRTPEYREIFKALSEDLKLVFKTGNDCLVFASSGTGAMEASLVNILSPGDKAVVIRGGKFGERYYEICEAFGVSAIPIDIEWGTSPDPQVIKDALNKNRGVKAVFTQLVETSTASVYDIKAIGGLVKGTDAVLVVDAISGLGADDLETDSWGVDIAVGGSQKALMLPPGLSFCSVSQKAWSMVKGSKLPKYYYDFSKYKKSKEKNDTPFTPAITLAIGLKKALEHIKSAGIDNILKECETMAQTVRGAAKDLGLRVFSKAPSNALTALEMTEGRDSSLLVKAIKERGIIVADGQAHLKGRIIRIAHMGGITRQDVERTIRVLKEALDELKNKNARCKA